MSPGVVVAVIVGVFFVIGVTVGIIAVIALSTVRRDRAGLAAQEHREALIRLSGPGQPAGPPEEPDDYDTGASGVPGHWDGVVPDGSAADRPHWPGDEDSS